MYDYIVESEYLKDYVRPVTEEDKKKLPTYSHSKLEVYENCPYRYSLQYEQGKRSNETTLALELGTICHRVYEIASQMWKNGLINYEDLKFILEYGDTDEKISGIKDLSKKYFEEWYESDSEGHTYKWKMDQFYKGLHEYISSFSYNGWIPFKEEYDFEFVFNDRAIIHGFIDAILINTEGDMKTIDFKTSKKPFPDNKIPTSQQFSIYCMGMLNAFGKLPVQCDYKFILLNQEQNALTSGFGKRIVKKLNTVLDNIDKNGESGIWIPNSTPLCHWCSYSGTNPKAIQYKGECEYYSLWTPTDKRWDVNKRFNALDLTNDKDVNKINGSNNGDDKKQRKLIF